jgi:hypothetical protein
MKTTVTNNIFDVANERGSKRFERNVFTILKRNGIFGDVVCIDAGVIGKFNTFATIEIDKKEIYLTDKNIFIGKIETAKQKRNLFFEVLGNQIETLKTQIKKG